jgi:hypothetical protein
MSANHHTPVVGGANADAAVVNAPLGQLDSKLSGLLAGNETFDQLNIGAGATALVVASNAITISKSIHQIDTTGGAPVLNTINGSTSGDILILSISSNTNICTLTTAGNISTRNGQSVILRNIRDYIILVYRNSKWNEIGSSPLEFWSMGGSSPFFPGGLYLSPSLVSDTAARLPRLEVMPSPVARNSWSARASGGVITPVGIPAMTTAGTLSEASSANTTYVNFASAAVLNSAYGFNSTTFNLVHIENSPEFYTVIETGAAADLANVRWWIGLTSAVPTNVDDLAAGTKAIMFRYSTAAGDAGWLASVDDGASVSSTATGVPLAANTQYKLRIRVNWATQLAYFSVNGAAEIAISVSALSGTKLGFTVVAWTLAAAAKNLLFSRAYCEFS